jgi:antitoxin component of MazEF toxin-antitoxin module
MNDKNAHIQEVGAGGRIRLPKEVMDALDVGPGNQIKIEIQGDIISIARHQVKDPFAALKNKKTPGLQELMSIEEKRKKEAARVFEERMQEKHEIRPEDREDFWK